MRSSEEISVLSKKNSSGENTSTNPTVRSETITGEIKIDKMPSAWQLSKSTRSSRRASWQYCDWPVRKQTPEIPDAEFNAVPTSGALSPALAQQMMLPP